MSFFFFWQVSSTQEDPKEQIVTQKLSINLRRLNNTYKSLPPSEIDKPEDNTSSSDEHSEQAPDFPPPTPPIMLRINAQTLSSAVSGDGKITKKYFYLYFETKKFI